MLPGRAFLAPPLFDDSGLVYRSPEAEVPDILRSRWPFWFSVLIGHLEFTDAGLSKRIDQLPDSNKNNGRHVRTDRAHSKKLGA